MGKKYVDSNSNLEVLLLKVDVFKKYIGGWLVIWWKKRWRFQLILLDTPQKTNIDTKIDGLEDVCPFKHGYLMGWKMYVLSNMAILGSYFRFRVCNKMWWLSFIWCWVWVGDLF